ncbi:DUF4168 domain-containing protein [bacterium]|nr:DUF4168 domain-containing protein [bacterium]
MMVLKLLKDSGQAGLVLLVVLALFLGGCNKAQKETGQSGSEGTQGSAQQSQEQPPAGMGTPPTPATDVSDEELKIFAELMEETQKIQYESQEEMQNAVTGTGMSIERYSNIMQQMQGQGQGESTEISDEEQIQLGEAQEALQKIQMDTQQKMIAAVEEGGMSTDRFQSILMAIRSDPSMQQRLQQLMQP